MSENWGPAYGLTDKEHAILQAARGRPVTDGPMRAAKTESDAGDPDIATGSIIDHVIAQTRREAK